MRAVWLVFGTELHRRWRSWLALVVMIALVGGLVLAAVATGRRTTSALPRFVAAHGYDAGVFSYQPLASLAKLPEVVSVVPMANPANGQPTCACTHPIDIATSSFNLVVPGPADLDRIVKLTSGHLPDQSSTEQVLASFTMQRDQGVHVGSVIHVPIYASSQEQDLVAASGAPPTPTGPTVSLRVVGIAVAETEFPTGGTASYDLFGTQALADELTPRATVAWQYLVRLRHGAADVPRFTADADAQGAAFVFNIDANTASVASSIHPQAVGWWVLAALGALAGLAVIGQALGRQTAVEGEEYPTLATLGFLRPQLVGLAATRNGLLGGVGALGAAAVAVALSPLTPVGEARLAEPATGVAVDPLVVVVGAVAIVVSVLLLGLWPSLRAARVRVVGGDVGIRPSTVVTRLAAAGAPPSAVIGVRRALVRGQGRAAVPAGTALFGMVMAVMALCATAVFGASLTHLTSTPALFGNPEAARISPPPGQTQAFETAVSQDNAIGQITLGTAQQIFVDKVALTVLAGRAVRGPALVSVVDGHFPSATDEIALGANTMRQVHAHLGSIVRVTAPVITGGTRTTPFRVVAQVSIPGDVGSGGLGTGAGMTLDGYLEASCPPGPTQADCEAATSQSVPYVLLVRGVPGRAGEAAIAHYLETDGQVTKKPVTPTSLVDFGEAVNFPLILGMVLVVFGAATLVHLLVVSVARRSRETGLLKALGFVNGQVGSVVCWQATSVAVVGIVVGVPLGVAVGQVVWRAFASSLGVVPVAAIQAWVIATLAVGVLLAANLLSIPPALAAARSKSAGQLLRTQ